jgi:hypothetical protein
MNRSTTSPRTDDGTGRNPGQETDTEDGIVRRSIVRSRRQSADWSGAGESRRGEMYHAGTRGKGTVVARLGGTTGTNASP